MKIQSDFLREEHTNLLIKHFFQTWVTLFLVISLKIIPSQDFIFPGNRCDRCDRSLSSLSSRSEDTEFLISRIDVTLPGRFLTDSVGSHGVLTSNIRNVGSIHSYLTTRNCPSQLSVAEGIMAGLALDPPNPVLTLFKDVSLTG